jgi:hypothetical protein
VTALLALPISIFAQYGGPAILTRGQAPSAMSASQIDFQPFLSVNGMYSSGLAGVSIDQNGKIVSDSSYGISVAAGITGLHSWKHTKVGLSYRAMLQHNPQASFYDGTTQELALGITHMLSRHVMLSSHTSAGISSQNYLGATLISTVPFDPNTLYRPTTDFFDNRTVFATTQLNLTIQKSTRLSYNLGVEGFLTRRRSTALYGVGGAGVRGDVQYRLTRRSTIGAAYNYTHFAFHGIFSGTDVHSAMGSYSITLTRATEFSGFAGVSRYETKFVQSVAVDPAIAALIGITSAERVFYGKSVTPNFAARLSRTVRRGVLFVSAGRGITPGNGLFLTSVSNNVTGGYSYAGLRHWSIAATGTYTDSRSVGNVIGNYGNYSSALNVGRKVAPHTTGNLSFVATHASSTDFKNYNKWQYAVNMGFTFAPGDVALRFW